MRLASEFVRLPFEFDVERLQYEAAQFTEYDWGYHPQRYEGNTALNLVARGGENNNAYTGSMEATPALEKCPYIKQIMARFDTVIGRSRFMRLAPGKIVPSHSDTDYTWRNRVRIHVPIVTHPSIVFSSIESISRDEVVVHKQAGEAWIFDNWREHSVRNEADIWRVHLVIDTVGSSKFWQMVDNGLDPKHPKNDWEQSIEKVEFDPSFDSSSLSFERFNALPVRSPDEMEALTRDFLIDLDYPQVEKQRDASGEILNAVCQDWRALWAQYLDAEEGIEHYLDTTKQAKLKLREILDGVHLKSNAASAIEVIDNWLDNAVEEGAETDRLRRSGATNKANVYAGKIPVFKQPVFIVSAPRAGSTMLYEALKNNREIWSVGDELHSEIESIESLHPKYSNFVSNALGAKDYRQDIGKALLANFMPKLQNFRCKAYADLSSEFQPSEIRFLDKTPKNSLRIRFFKAMFPDAKFIYVHRAPESNIASIMDAWESRKFTTYDQLKGAPDGEWSFLLNEGWRDYSSAELAKIALHQWSGTNEAIMSALSELDRSEWISVDYESLVADSGMVLKSVCDFLGLPFGPKMQEYAQTGFPNTKYVLSEPSPKKWMSREAEIMALAEGYASCAQQIEAL